MKVEIVNRGDKWYWIVYTDETQSQWTEGMTDTFEEAVLQVEGVV